MRQIESRIEQGRLQNLLLPTNYIVNFASALPQALCAQNDRPTSLLLVPQQLQLFVPNIFPFGRGTIRQSSAVRILPLTGRVEVCRLEDDVLLRYHLGSKSRQMALSQLPCVSRLQVAIIYATSLQA